MQMTLQAANLLRARLPCFIALNLLNVIAVAAVARAYHPRIGQPHADFTLPAIDDGRPVSLSDFRGKKVLLIHFASW
jgi:hypothetical protein